VKITFLGTGTSTGVPMIACNCEVCTSADYRDKRLRSSVLIQHNNKNIVIDCGPDFRQQMLKANVQSVEAILMTHGHRDHTGGIDDIRAYNFALKRDIDFYLNESTEEILLRHFDYAFDIHNKYPAKPRLKLNLIEDKPFKIDDIEILPIKVLHGNMPVLGFRINDFTYITDANYIPEEEKEKIKGSKVLVLNALRWYGHPSHFTAQEAIALAEEINAPTTYFAHISHHLGLHADIEENKLGNNMWLAYDGLQIEL
jgi:phosphoribosyl 1,2-cyclic phosphate phosphodiesterase